MLYALGQLDHSLLQVPHRSTTRDVAIHHVPCCRDVTLERIDNGSCPVTAIDAVQHAAVAATVALEPKPSAFAALRRSYHEAAVPTPWKAFLQRRTIDAVDEAVQAIEDDMDERSPGWMLPPDVTAHRHTLPLTTLTHAMLAAYDDMADHSLGVAWGARTNADGSPDGLRVMWSRTRRAPTCSPRSPPGCRQTCTKLPACSPSVVEHVAAAEAAFARAGVSGPLLDRGGLTDVLRNELEALCDIADSMLVVRDTVLAGASSSDVLPRFETAARELRTHRAWLPATVVDETEAFPELGWVLKGLPHDSTVAATSPRQPNGSAAPSTSPRSGVSHPTRPRSRSAPTSTSSPCACSA